MFVISATQNSPGGKATKYGGVSTGIVRRHFHATIYKMSIQIFADTEF